MSTNRIDVIGVSGKTAVALKKAYRAHQYKRIQKWVKALSVMGPPVYFAASLMDYWAHSAGIAMALESWLPHKSQSPQALTYFFLLDPRDKITAVRVGDRRLLNCAKLVRKLILECLSKRNHWLEPICCLVVIRGLTVSARDADYQKVYVPIR